jgi:hypothetical protein
LASAAHAYELQTGGLAGTSTLNGFACDGTYAGANAGTTSDGGYGFALSFQLTGSAWSVIASGNLLPPTGLPSTVYTQLRSELQAVTQNQSFPF